MLRRLAAFVMLGLGVWLAYGGLHALVTIVGYGSGLGDALFSPPTTFLRLLGAGLMVLGGLVAVLGLRRGAAIAIAGAVLFILMGGLMAVSGADRGLWLDEVVYGVCGLALGVLIATLKRV